MAGAEVLSYWTSGATPCALQLSRENNISFQRLECVLELEMRWSGDEVDYPSVGTDLSVPSHLDSWDQMLMSPPLIS